MSASAETRWTDAEDAALRRLYDSGLTDAEIGLRLNRTRLAVGVRRCKMRLLKTGNGALQQGGRWPADDTQRLRVMHAAGHTPREIAKALDRTRDSVLGKLVRLGLTVEDRQRLPVAAAPEPSTPQPSASQPVSTRSACAWIDGDVLEPGWSYCGEPVEPGTPYCPAHCARAYRRVTPDQADAVEAAV